MSKKNTTEVVEVKKIETETNAEEATTTETVKEDEEKKESLFTKLVTFGKKHRKKAAIVVGGVVLTAVGYALGARKSSDDPVDAEWSEESSEEYVEVEDINFVSSDAE